MSTQVSDIAVGGFKRNSARADRVAPLVWIQQGPGLAV